MISIAGLELALVTNIQAWTSHYRLKTGIRDLARNPVTSGVSVYRQMIPKRLTGESDPEFTSDYPSVLVRVTKGKFKYTEGTITANIIVATIDDDTDQQGGQDTLNLIETITDNIWMNTPLPQGYSIDEVEFMMLYEHSTPPVYAGMLTTTWKAQTPSQWTESVGYDYDTVTKDQLAPGSKLVNNVNVQKFLNHLG